MGSAGVLAVYILTGAAGNLLSTLVNWVLYHNAPGGPVFPAGRGSLGRRVRDCRCADRAAQVEPIAGAPYRVEKAAPVGDLLCSAQPGAWSFDQLWQSVAHSGLNIDNMAHVGGFTCGLLFAAPMVPRIGSPRALFESRLRIAIDHGGGLLVLFGFYLAQLPRVNCR